MIFMETSGILAHFRLKSAYLEGRKICARNSQEAGDLRESSGSRDGIALDESPRILLIMASKLQSPNSNSNSNPDSKLGDESSAKFRPQVEFQAFGSFQD